MDRATVELVAEDGESAALVISRLPSSVEPLDQANPNARVVLREGRTYRFELSDGKWVELQPAELFDIDDSTRRSGRLSPGEAVGIVTVAATRESGQVFRGQLDVRSAKFEDETAFSTMIADLARLAVESLHQGFAPSAGHFSASLGPTPRLLYQQFAVLSALLESGDLRWAINFVLAQPHRVWETELEKRSPGLPLKGSSRLSTQLSRPGARVPTLVGPLASLPRDLLIHRTEETLDTLPNRYLRFVLESWRGLATTVVHNADSLSGAARRRGVSQAARVIDELDEILGDQLFREVSQLTSIPGDNQVLRRREGYRQIALAASFVEGALGLDLDLEDLFLVSRKSIATLYEYWTFVRLSGAVARAFGRPGVEADLWRASRSGMSLVLRAGASTRMKFETSLEGRSVNGDLFFNREFRDDSWTRPMRPDASLVLRVPNDHEMWLHFDAKYKVDWQRPFDTGDPDDEEAAERIGMSKRTDLLKMHAYRDAIRNSAGSYVLFPGSEPAGYAVDSSEFLPGLGAFPLRPDRAEDDTAMLQKFVTRALGHVAAAGTKHRRARYWTAKAYEDPGTNQLAAQPPVGDVPPADAPVLVGYVRSREQWNWIHRAWLYNIRSGDRPGALSATGPELDGAIILLHGPEAVRRSLYRRTSSWQAADRSSMERMGYPHARGDSYLLAPIQPAATPPWLDLVDLRSLAPRNWLIGQPFRVSWLDLVLAAEDG